MLPCCKNKTRTHCLVRQAWETLHGEFFSLRLSLHSVTARLGARRLRAIARDAKGGASTATSTQRAPLPSPIARRVSPSFATESRRRSRFSAEAWLRTELGVLRTTCDAIHKEDVHATLDELMAALKMCVDCRRLSYQDCHMLSYSPSRGPLKLYQDYHIFPIIARRYVKVDTEREFFTSFVQLAETLMRQARPAANPRASRSVLAFALKCLIPLYRGGRST